MKLSIIESGFFKLDGGAMFGVVPKSLWSKQNPPDEKNLCTWSMRLLLIETGDRKILIDAGIGNKQSEKFMSHFEPHGDDSIHSSLQDKNLKPSDITDVFITHLHFDHVGGALYKNENKEIVPTFPNAKYWTNQKHFDWAFTPNDREKASFLKENFVPLADQGILKYIPTEEGFQFTDDIHVHFAYGHTEAMMTPHIHLPNGNVIIYTADLMPSSYHIRMPYVMAYDIRPMITLEEKKKLYETAIKDNVYLFFEHDPVHPLGKLYKNEKGRFAINTDLNWNDIIQTPLS